MTTDVMTVAPDDGLMEAANRKANEIDPALVDYVEFYLLNYFKPGQYRVSADVALWIDVVANGKVIPSVDFGSAHDCSAPRKVVVYDLPATQALTVQLSGSSAAQAHITLTPATAQKP